jgi:hypothetical protein
MEDARNKIEGQEVNGFVVTQNGKRLRIAYKQSEPPLKPYPLKDSLQDLDDFDENKLIGDEAFGLTPLATNKRKADTGGTKRKKRRRNNKKTKRNRRKIKRNRK